MGIWSSVIGLVPFFVSMGAALAIAIIYKAVSRRTRRRSPLAGGFYPDNTDTSRKPHHGAGGVPCHSEGSSAKSSSVKRWV